MPLIVAIEPDGRQAARLLKLARGPLNAKLVVAESTAQALGAFDEGVPDLILTSPRLSKKDEKALADRLKTLDAAAAHVQRLTIPIFAAAGPARGKRHISRTRRSSDFLTEGCDPELFAERIAEYLELAAAERALLDAGTGARAADIKSPVEAPPAATIVEAKPVQGVTDVKPVHAAPSIGRLMDEVLSTARPAASAHSSTAKTHLKSKIAEAPIPVAPTEPPAGNARRDMDLTAFIKEVLGPDAAPIAVEAIAPEPIAIEPVAPMVIEQSESAHSVQSITVESTTEGAADILNSAVDPLDALLAIEPISLKAARSTEIETTSVELGDINSIDLSTYVHQLEVSENVEPSVIELLADTTADALAIELEANPVEPATVRAAEPQVTESIAAEAPVAGNEDAAVFEVGDFDVSLLVRFGEHVTFESPDTPVEQPAVPVDPAAEVFEVGEFDPSLLATFGGQVAEVAAAPLEELTVLLAATVVEQAHASVPELAAESASAPVEHATEVPAAEAEPISLEAAVSPEEQPTDAPEPEPISVEAAAAEQIAEPVATRRNTEWATVDVRRRGSLLSRLQGWLSGHRPRLKSETVAPVRLSPDQSELQAGEAEPASPTVILDSREPEIAEEIAAMDAAAEITLPLEAPEPAIVSTGAEVVDFVEPPQAAHETEAESDLWMALPPEPPRVWPRLEAPMAAAEELVPTVEELVAAAEELVVVDAIQVVPEAANLLEATGEPWTIDSAIEDTDVWVASPLVLQTWPRLDWFVLDKTQIVSPNEDLITASVSIAELEVSTETVWPALRKNKKKTKIKTRKTERPAQDEWGMFDPEQCGIAAVLAKLDVDDTTDATERRPRNRRA